MLWAKKYGNAFFPGKKIPLIGVFNISPTCILCLYQTFFHTSIYDDDSVVSLGRNDQRVCIAEPGSNKNPYVDSGLNKEEGQRKKKRHIKCILDDISYTDDTDLGHCTTMESVIIKRRSMSVDHVSVPIAKAYSSK